MANQLRKLKKRQLLELLVAQGKELEAKQQALLAAQKQIAGLEGRLVKLGAGVRKAPRTEDGSAAVAAPEADGSRQPSERTDP